MGLVCAAFLPPSKNVEAKRHSQPIDLSIHTNVKELMVESFAPVAQTQLPTIDWHKEKVRPGDNLSLIFHRAGLSDRDLYVFMKSNEATDHLKKIHPGHELEFNIEEGRLLSLRYRKTQLESELYSRTKGDSFDHKIELIQPDVHLAYREATITDSLFLAGQKAHMDVDLIMELASVFGWDIDFALDIRSGDQFRVLFEERFLDGQKVGNGNILAAEFINQGNHFRAVRYQNPEGVAHYYNPEGKSMRKAFLRAPLDFRRISSNFNPRRLHPIMKTVRPHRGTDYAASRGTPVWASGDGRVLQSGYSKPNGNYIVLQHGNNIQTKYLHLDKRLVKKGQRVRQKQKIGTVGTTGYSTAPHLHYEFLLDGVHRNPRTILEKLPKAASVPQNELAEFTAQTQPLLANLEKHHQEVMLARVDDAQ